MDAHRIRTTAAFRRRLRALGGMDPQAPLEPLADRSEGQTAFRERLRGLKGCPLDRLSALED